MTIPMTEWAKASAAEQGAVLSRPASQSNLEVRGAVDKIIAQVRGGGDAAIRELTKRLDGADLKMLQATPAEFARAEDSLAAGALDAIDLAIRNVRLFHEAQLPRPVSIETMPGVRCERISQPIDSVGLYVPAGSAPLPSAAIMLATPATIANCPRKIMCTPPRPDGSADPAVLVAAKRAGVTNVFKVGGAQAIAAMAFGTETIPKTNKIFGPGNAWVTEAKSQVASDPSGAAIDMPAGPSEVLVIADANANAAFVASDLLSQAEHGTDSQVLLVTDCPELASAVSEQVALQLSRLERSEIAATAISNSRVIVTADLDTALKISNEYAPEHLILHTGSARELLADVRNAGSIFIGAWSPESVGDYCSGTNHVLPTYGYARNYSGLSVDQFMRQMTVQELTPAGLKAIAPAVLELAGLEGLGAHAAAVQLRLDQLETGQ